MLDGNHRIYAAHGVKGLERPLYIPSPTLGVGAAETLGSVPVQFQVQQKRPTRLLLMDMSDDFTKGTIDGQSYQLDESMFPKTGYMGDWITGG